MVVDHLEVFEAAMLAEEKGPHYWCAHRIATLRVYLARQSPIG
jgi:hypothetical protein